MLNRCARASGCWEKTAAAFIRKATRIVARGARLGAWTGPRGTRGTSGSALHRGPHPACRPPQASSAQVAGNIDEARRSARPGRTKLGSIVPNRARRQCHPQ